MKINVHKLWNEGGYVKDNPLDRSIMYVKKFGKENNVPDGVVDTIIAETFLGLANGDKYPLDKCPCGCGIDKSGTAIVHHMTKRVAEFGEKVREETAKIIENNLNTMILNHVNNQNKQYTEKNLKRNPFLDWNRSETVKLYRRIYGFFRNR